MQLKGNLTYKHKVRLLTPNKKFVHCLCVISEQIDFTYKLKCQAKFIYKFKTSRAIDFLLLLTFFEREIAYKTTIVTPPLRGQAQNTEHLKSLLEKERLLVEMQRKRSCTKSVKPT